MPTYEYKCIQCHHKQEYFHKITDTPIKLCPQCGHETLRRGPGGGAGILFKGTGFYKTDYASNLPIETSSPNNSSCCPCGKNQNTCKE